MALKAAIQLELTRRENDKKVLVLKTQMLDMMDGTFAEPPCLLN